MKDIPYAVLHNFTSAVSSRAELWKIQRKDGKIFGFTSHDKDITFDGLVYRSRAGFNSSQISTQAGFSVDNLKTSGYLDLSFITEWDLLTRKWDGARVWLARCNWRNPAAGIEKMRKGRLGEMGSTKVSFEVELLGLMQQMQQTVGKTYLAECNAQLGDTRCKVALAAFTVTGTVTTGGGHFGFTDSSRTEADGWFTNGELTITSGLNKGLEMEVKSYASGTFELLEALPGLISAGDTYSVYAGCNLLRDGDCANKFNNRVNHRGFPSKPTEDQVAAFKV